jgi:uncharacterized protein (DUF305 family)
MNQTLIIIIAIYIIFYFYNNNNNIKNFTESFTEGFTESNICRGKLTDKEFLQHMIPHHQVAIDISKMLQKISKSPLMQDLLRKLIWTQEFEIKLMNVALENLPEKDMSPDNNMLKVYEPTISDYLKPNGLDLTKTYCDPNFFNPEEHMKHLKHMKLNDKMYLEHMIPHHQVAVDMSKVLLKNTTSDFMIYLAYRIIRSQQAEIIILEDLKKSPYKHNSDIITQV